MAASTTTPAAEPISENYQIWRLQTELNVRQYEKQQGSGTLNLSSTLLQRK